MPEPMTTGSPAETATTPARETYSEPPDTRGGTAALPLAVFATGILSVVVTLGGLLFVQYLYAAGDYPLSPECRERMTIEVPGQDRKLVPGAAGVCHIVAALDSALQTVLLGTGIGLGVAAAVLGLVVYKRLATKRMRSHAIAGSVLGLQAVVAGAVLASFRAGDTFTFARSFLNFKVLEGSLDGFVRGAKNTLVLAFAGELGGIVIGLLLALLVLSPRRVVRAPARGYINLFRGTPLIWQLSFFYFLLRLGFSLDISSFSAAIFVFCLNTGAYAAEVFRAGIQSIEKGQTEAARSLGMTYLQSMAYVVVPQAVRRVIPPLMNEFVILIKDTSLIVVLGLTAAELDIFSFSRQWFSDSRNATVFIATAAAYLAVTLPLIRLVNYVEHRLRSGLVGVGM